MASALIVPGVQVKTQFEPAPVLAGATGILGVVGVTDYGPIAPTPVGSFGEFLSLFGPASAYSMPEVRTAFINGVKEVVVARIGPGHGAKASLQLLDDEGDKVATLEARAEGAWGSALSARVSQVRTLSGAGLKYINLTLLRDGEELETLGNLVMDETSPNYLFDQINARSKLVIAYDPLFEKALPVTAPKRALTSENARAASAFLKAGATDVLGVAAKTAGPKGNLTGIKVSDGFYGLTLQGVDVRARKAGDTGKNIRIAVTPGAPSGINLTVSVTQPLPPVSRSYTGLASVDDLIAALEADPDVAAVKVSETLPAPIAATALSRRVTIDVITEGRDTVSHPNLADLDAIVALSDAQVAFTKVGAATALPETTVGVPLEGGRAKGPALALAGDDGGNLLELQPTPEASGVLAVEVARGLSTIDGTTPVINLKVFVDDVQTESFSDLTLDPDDPSYLPAVLRDSKLLRGLDLFARSHSVSLPSTTPRPQAFTGGISPRVDDYQDALDRLESAEEVDLVIASVANQLDDAGVIAVHQAVSAHCTKMADVARNRIGLGSVTKSATSKPGARVAAILDHADSVRSYDFVLSTPAGSEAAVAGLLSLQDYFQSPTFKNVPALGVPPGDYSDAELNQLVSGNVLVVNQKRKLGTIVIKGVLTKGRQINVQRTANKAVRDVKAIADVYIGLLNNEGNRNALLQQIIAMFLQMTRDGALVPSTDGKDPPFKVEVYSTQADFANGIVRIDIAIRPVRAIDYIYATILVQN